MITIDYSRRPEDYSEPFDPEELMLSRITGAARREAVRKMVRDGGMDAVPEGFGNEELSERHRTAWARRAEGTPLPCTWGGSVPRPSCAVR